GQTAGTISFEYHNKTVNLGLEVDEAEAKSILNALGRHTRFLEILPQTESVIASNVSVSTKWRIADTGSGLRIILPNRRSWLLIGWLWFCTVFLAFILITLGLWALAELSGRSPDKVPVGILAFSFYLLTALLLARELHWLLQGHELIEISQHSLIL